MRPRAGTSPLSLSLTAMSFSSPTSLPSPSSHMYPTMLLTALCLGTPFLFVIARIFVQWVKQAPLRNIRGPSRQSLWKGEHFFLAHCVDVTRVRTQTETDLPPAIKHYLGNLGQLFDSRNWKFHADILRDYGRVVRLHGLFGVQFLFQFGLRQTCTDRSMDRAIARRDDFTSATLVLYIIS